MPNEELIYRITRAVYGRLSAKPATTAAAAAAPPADEQTLENLVTDIYRAVEPLIAGRAPRGGGGGDNGGGGGGDAEGSSDRIIISVFGVDHPGIVAGVSQVLAEAQCSIIDINQTVVQGKFAMVIIADTTRARESASALKDRFRKEGDRLGVRIYAQREDLFNAMHRV